MVYPLIARGAAALLAKQAGKQVAKKAPGRSEKFMGMAEEVKPLRLSDEVMRAGERAAGPAAEAGMSMGTKTALTAGTAAGLGLGAAALRSRREEEPAKESPRERKAAEEKEETPSAKAPAAKKSATRIAFEREFAKNRAAGEKEFSFRGQTYTTRYDGETAAQHRKKMEEIVDAENRHQRNRENIGRAAREEAKQSTKIDEMRKGGMVKKQTYAKGGAVMANCGASMKPQQRKK